jgi:hypothetical protein
MKKIINTIIAACLMFTGAFAQDAAKPLDEALSSYKAGELLNARFALQQALNEIDRAIGAEILAALPTQMGDMKFVEAEDNITAMSTGFAGLFVHRNYASENSTASVDIISDSPMLAGINTILALPFFGTDSNQKRIRVGNYRALLQKNVQEDGTVSWDIQIPVNKTLVTFNCKGIADENAVTRMANTIPVDQISRYAN